MSMPYTHVVAPSISPGDAFGMRVLTLAETAGQLRCSKSHIHNIIAGKVNDLPPLPVLRIGRKRLIRYDALKNWLMSLEAREVETQKLTGFFG